MDNKLLETVYLRVKNNSVSDIVQVETKDLVRLEIPVSYRVHFEGDDHERWFAVENYIGLLCDQMRSLIRNVVKRVGIEEFYGNAIDILRDAALGKVDATKSNQTRPGRAFAENGMRVYDLEVLDVVIKTDGVGKLLAEEQFRALESAMTIAAEERELGVTRRSQQVKQTVAQITAETAEQVSAAAQREVKAKLDEQMTRLQSEADLETQRLEHRKAEQADLDAISAAELARRTREQDADVKARAALIEVELKKLLGETEQIVKRAGAVDAKLSAALVTLSDASMVERLATNLAPMAAMYGISAAEVLGNLFKGTPLAGIMDALSERSKPVPTQE